MNENKTTVFLGADHAGFELKENLKKSLQDACYALTDISSGPADPNDDYPDIAKKVAEKILTQKALGILICGSGNGVCLAANKIKGIRAAVGYNTQAAKWAREHLDANILCLAGRALNPEYASAIARHFLETPFSEEERHKRRIEKIKKMEEL